MMGVWQPMRGDLFVCVWRSHSRTQYDHCAMVRRASVSRTSMASTPDRGRREDLEAGEVDTLLDDASSTNTPVYAFFPQDVPCQLIDSVLTVVL